MLFATAVLAAEPQALDPAENKQVFAEVEVSANLVEASKREFLVHLTLGNTADSARLMRLHDMSCRRGDELGTLHQELSRRGFIFIGERSIVLMAGETKRLKLVCEHRKSSGEIAVRLGPIMGTKNGADSTGTLLEQAEWVLPEAAFAR